ncbi:hypothetical protein RSAG8_06863, partial [Rhizoctonia solani AG-8 WAC10335]
MITRSIELFGSPWSARWVANLKVGVDTRETVVGRTSDFLCALPWHHALVEPLTYEGDGRGRLRRQRGQSTSSRCRIPDSDTGRTIPSTDTRDRNRHVKNPQWPSDTPAPQDLGLSWSSSAERDTSYTRNPSYRAYLPPGKQTFPRPKRIVRFYPWDSHLIVVLASPAARRAVMAAYAWWVRRKVVDAYNEKDEPGKPVVLPPVNLEELKSGGVPVESEEREAVSWASEVGWRPEYRIRPYRGRRNKNDDGEGWYETEIKTRKRFRERKRELERERLEVAESQRAKRKESEDGDLDSEGSNLDQKR